MTYLNAVIPKRHHVTTDFVVVGFFVVVVGWWVFLTNLWDRIVVLPHFLC